MREIVVSCGGILWWLSPRPPDCQCAHKEPPLPVYAQFATTQGNFTVRLHDAEAPKTVENFIGLAEGTKEWTDPRSNKRVTQRSEERRVGKECRSRWSRSQ